MKRLLQGLAVLQVLLVAALVWRIVNVWTTPLPEAGEIPELPAVTQLPPPKPVPKISDAVTTAVVEHDLFDEARGHKDEDIIVDGLDPNATPVPPPSSVKLTGVMVLDGQPVGFLLDTNLKPEQQAVRKGEMFGEYEVGDITPMGLLLLGTGGQQFQIPLKVEAAAGGAVAAGAPAGPPPPPRTPGTRPTPPPKPVTAKPAPGKADANEADTKTMSARERAQAIAQRNAELRKQRNEQNAEEAEPGAAGAENEANPVQARLEALRQLREAAKTR